MPYFGKTFVLPCNEGGWNANTNIELIPPSSMVDVKNLNLNKGGRGTRGGVDVVNGTVISGSPQVMGVYQFRLKNGSDFIVTATDDGKIQKDYTTTVLKTGLTADKYSLFETFENVLYVCNGADVPETWNGAAATTTTLVAIPTDWAGTNQPKQMIKHGRGASERLWAFGCPLNPERIYASENGNADFTDAKVIQINIETSDGFGIVAGIEFGDRIFFFGKRNTYIIDDTNTDATKWGYEAAQWDGGAAHERLICRTPNDLIAVTDDLDVYSVVAAESYGDYKAASLTRPAFINRWIDDNVDKSQINKFHIIYDSELRAIKLFVVRTGHTAIDTCLVYFLDLGPEKGWSKHEYASENFASCSGIVRISTGFKIYTGGYNGFVYKFETETFNDDGVAYYNGFTTPYGPVENSRQTKRFDRLWFMVVPQGTETILANIYVDGGVLSSFVAYVTSAIESIYPPVQSDTYVKATSKYSTAYWPYFTTDPLSSLIGNSASNQWLSFTGQETNQRFHIDLGNPEIITQIYYENSRHFATNMTAGAKNFTFWGSNDAADFADLIYANDGTWVNLTTYLSSSQLEIHDTMFETDPKYITTSIATAYRYYAFKFADNWGDTNFMGVRRIELQHDPSYKLVDENGNYVMGNLLQNVSATASSLQSLQSLNSRIGRIGERIQIEVYNNTINTSFFISQIMLDFMPLGPKSH